MLDWHKTSTLPPLHFHLQLLNFPLNGGSEVVVMPWSKSSVMRPISDLVGSLSVYVWSPGPMQTPSRSDGRKSCRRFFAAAFLDSSKCHWHHCITFVPYV